MTDTVETLSHVPAAPGWYVCDPICDDDDTNLINDFCYLSIVAWMLHTKRNPRNGRLDTECEPVCTEYYSQNPILLTPGGHYYEPSTAEFESKQQALDRATQKERQMEELRQARLARLNAAG